MLRFEPLSPRLFGVRVRNLLAKRLFISSLRRLARLCPAAHLFAVFVIDGPLEDLPPFLLSKKELPVFFSVLSFCWGIFYAVANLFAEACR